MAKWQLNPAEVSSSSGRSSSGKPGQMSRRLKETACTVVLRHLPTGLEVAGEVPEGNYSKAEMKKRREHLTQQLFALLEKKVGEHLRIPGR